MNASFLYLFLNYSSMSGHFVGFPVWDITTQPAMYVVVKSSLGTWVSIFIR